VSTTDANELERRIFEARHVVAAARVMDVPQARLEALESLLRAAVKYDAPERGRPEGRLNALARAALHFARSL
jgi:hypothetical protein